MIIDIDDFDEVGYAAGQFQEVVVRRRDGSYFGPYSRYFMNKPMPYCPLAHRLCGSVFILSSEGEGETVRLRQAMPTANFIYPTLHRPSDYEELNGHKANPVEMNCRRKMPFRMSFDNQSTEAFKKALEPYCDGRQFRMTDDVYMLMMMRF